MIFEAELLAEELPGSGVLALHNPAFIGLGWLLSTPVWSYHAAILRGKTTIF